MAREAWTGIAWAAALVLAIAAVFVFESSRFELTQYEVGWAERTVSGSSSGQLAVDEVVETMFAVPGANVSQVVVRVTWNDPNGGDDEFEVTVRGPGGRMASQSGATGALEVVLPLLEVPPTITVEGVSLEHACSEVPYPEPLWEGAAAWNLTVRLVSAPGLSTPTGIELQPDGQNTYAVEYAFTTFEPRLMEL